MVKNKRYIYIIIFTLLLIIPHIIVHTYARIGILSETSIQFFIDTIIHKNIEYSQDYIRNHVPESSPRFQGHWLRLIKHYISLPLDGGYGSHKLALLAALILTSKDGGPILEMGCGYHSTNFLHQIAVNEQKRFVLSTDTDYEWILKFKTNMSSSLHQFRFINLISEWNGIGNDRSRWSIVLVDHKPGERRVLDIIRLVNMTDILIVHDTETNQYGYERGLFLYPYKYHYTYLSTGTDIASKSNATLLQNIKHLLELTISMKIPK
ncbi:unnamed protein product [Adineta steineri]|uniref:Uncharacterized protein n=1 Tax=Adineta steineri TaxID=433720 RepID=A0A819P3N0_9BILA|nr:unnamed protein product [Adineta steineri]CAF4003949.1 unnamed protein product [Adineta steineri]